MIFSLCFTSIYLHDQVGAQGVYTWRRRESLTSSRDTFNEIRDMFLFSLVPIYILSHFILIFVFLFCYLLHSTCRSHVFRLIGIKLGFKKGHQDPCWQLGSCKSTKLWLSSFCQKVVHKLLTSTPWIHSWEALLEERLPNCSWVHVGNNMLQGLDSKTRPLYCSTNETATTICVHKISTSYILTRSLGQWHATQTRTILFPVLR
jgi:hypothetical protein